jgi:hypothetical protein
MVRGEGPKEAQVRRARVISFPCHRSTLTRKDHVMAKKKKKSKKAAKKM